jgi:hypothetical protein
LALLQRAQRQLQVQSLLLQAYLVVRLLQWLRQKQRLLQEVGLGLGLGLGVHLQQTHLALIRLHILGSIALQHQLQVLQVYGAQALEQALLDKPQ